MTVPYFGVQSFLPDSDEYRELERRQVRDLLPGLIAAERPDVLLSRERQSVTVGIGKLAVDHGLPRVLLSRGFPLVAILNGTYPPAMAAQAVAEYRTASLAVAPGRHMTDGLRRLDVSSAITIPNAVDLAQFAPRAEERRPARGAPLRGGRPRRPPRREPPPAQVSLDVIESAGQAMRRHPSLRYVIVGDGVLRGELEPRPGGWPSRTASGSSDGSTIRRMPDYMNLADIVVMPSESEGLARVYLEAQACARVLIASDIAPAREVVTDGETGSCSPSATSPHSRSRRCGRRRIGSCARESGVTPIAGHRCTASRRRWRDTPRRWKASPAAAPSAGGLVARDPRARPPRSAPGRQDSSRSERLGPEPRSGAHQPALGRARYCRCA